MCQLSDAGVSSSSRRFARQRVKTAHAEEVVDEFGKAPDAYQPPHCNTATRTALKSSG